MSGIGWQDGVAALLVCCAVGYLVWRKLRPRKRPPLVKIGIGRRAAGK